MYGVKRTTVYLTDEQKRRLEEAAAEDGKTEAELIREGLDRLLEARARPRPALPLFERTGVATNWAERVDETLAETGFAE